MGRATVLPMLLAGVLSDTALTACVQYLCGVHEQEGVGEKVWALEYAKVLCCWGVLGWGVGGGWRVWAGGLWLHANVLDMNL